jgi:hypothetical protein
VTVLSLRLLVDKCLMKRVLGDGVEVLIEVGEGI